MSVQLPIEPTANERLLAGWELERSTGLTTTALTLNRPCYASMALVWKDGMLVDPDTYTVSGSAITLGAAATAGEVYVVWYLARSN